MQSSDLIISYLPHLNALLNVSAAILLGIGYYFIRKQSYAAHKICMALALMVSTLFLISYMIYHLRIGRTPFVGVGMVRPVYFSILASHVILAIVNLPLVVAVARYGIRGEIQHHLQLARLTLAMWAYVSLTGLIIYLMVFHIYS